ncbi:MAG: Hsp20/alpha crystallin family protein [Candidatus Woesearchaeota archaeon]
MEEKNDQIERYGRFGNFPYFRKSHIPQIFEDMNDIIRRLDSWPKIFTDKHGGLLDERFRLAVTNWKTEEKEYIGTIELPGMKKEEIKLNIKDSGLEIIAEQSDKKEEKDSKYESKRRFTTYETLPNDSDIEKITAAYNDGVLTVNIPRLDKANTNKGLEIKIN